MGKSHRSKVAISLLSTVLVLVFLLLGLQIAAASADLEEYRIPILVYHRFGDTVGDSMTVSVARFESQLRYLRDNHYEIIPLRRLV